MVAWTVPAIQVATAVPAFAGSGCCSLSASGNASWRAGELNYIDIPLDITNECSTAVTGLTVILTICGLQDITYTGEQYLPAGWVQGGKGNKKLDPDENGCYTLTFTSAQSLPGDTTTHPVFTAKTMAYTGSGDNRPAGSITVTVSTPGCSADTFSIVLPQVG
ncbi:MAG TPA: hypothetical protein VGK78_17030 [Nocardioides sp.]|uniref:hypothetical protein n=1 Tax=Nocardioides sp. TaxID=35761 RepID=UPI002F41F453